LSPAAAQGYTAAVSSHTRPRTVWAFGRFELDSQTGELRRDGILVRLTPQALQVLLALVEAPAELVSRDELRRRLWAEGTFVEFDRSLNFCLSRLRKALGDDARHPRFVQTLPGRGYRFIAPVQTRGLPVPALLPRRAPRTRLAAAAAVLALATLPASYRGVVRDARAESLYEDARALCGPDGWRRSVELYRQALARDPGFAAAHAGLASSYLALGEGGWLAPVQAFPPAEDAARRALALAETAEAHLVLGRALMAYEWDLSGAERELTRALALDPSSVPAWVALARLYSAGGDHEQAVRTAQHAEALDPASPEAIEELAWCYSRASRLDDAGRQFRLLMERRPEEAHHRLFELLRRAGRDREAMKEADALMQRVGVPEPQRAALRRMPPDAAAAAYLRGTVAHLQGEASRYRVPPERFALLYAALGDSGKALAFLSQAAEERSPGLVTALADPTLDSLRGQPDLLRLLQRVGAPIALASS
jgi:DNA-binding winged helix-turn-helix (wHTH) protein/Flp pilus assembly protein TadD